MERFSRQREAIRMYLSGRKDHPTAEQIYAALKAVIPNLSLATVYSNLSQMTESGEVRKLVSRESAPARYDYDISEHSHFFCRSCGALMDAPTILDEEGNKIVEDILKVEVDTVSTTYYGLCNKCRALVKVPTDGALTSV